MIVYLYKPIFFLVFTRNVIIAFQQLYYTIIVGIGIQLIII